MVSIAQAQYQDMKPYQNEIVGIQEIAGATTYTLVLSCLQLNPIVVYAPESFDESKQREVHRYLLPNTILSEELNNESVSVQQDGRHVIILLFGPLLLQTTGDHKANFMVKILK